jgi:tRNA(Ile2) C34 agmatinyltransferase TiaS
VKPVATVYPIMPEPCPECDQGLAWMECFDGAYRCRNCVHRYAVEHGFDKVPESLRPQVNPTTSEVDQTPTPPALPAVQYEQPRML